MIKELLGQNKNFFGLDIGHDTLKVIELRKKGGSNFSVYGFNESKIPNASFKTDGVKEKDAIIAAIKDSCKKSYNHPISCKKVVSALSDSLVFTKTIELPKMSEAEIERAIPHEAAESFPLPLEAIYLDWQTLEGKDISPKDKKNDKNNSTINVLLIAAPKRLVDDYTEIIKLAGLEFIRLETKPIAITRLINHLSTEDNLFITVDVGAGITGMSIYDTDNIRFTGTVSVGAEIIKKDSAKISIIIEEVEHLIKYYQTRMGKNQTNLKTIYLTGGGANIPEISTRINKELKISIKKIDTGKRISFPKNTAFDPKFSTALGLALPVE